MGDIQLLLAEIRRAKPAYEKAKRYSDGDVKEVWASPRIAKALSASAGHYEVNIARRPIDAVLDRLSISAVSVADDETATAVLNDIVWEPNELDQELPDLMDKAETFGDAYLVCWIDPETNMPLLMVNDPLDMRLIYDPENPRRKLFAGRTWLDHDNRRRVTIWRAGPTVERWVARKAESAYPDDGYKDGDFMPIPEEPDGPLQFEDLQLGLGVPVFHARTAKPYGVPTHRAAYGTQNMLTKDIATMMDATDGYGFPFRYMLTKVGLMGPGATFPNDDFDDEIPTGDSASPRPASVRASAGDIAKLTDVDAVGQLEPASIANFLDPISMTLRLSSVVTNTPLFYFDPSAAAASGESKREHEKPLVKKAERHLALYNSTIRDALEYALAMDTLPDTKVMISWDPVASVDEGEELDVAAKRKGVGVPFLTFMTELGYPAEEVQRWVDEATPDDEVLAGRVALLKDLAQAAQALGAAASLGVVDATQAQALITLMISKEGGGA